MKTIDVDSMVAGREMNAHVACELMGWFPPMCSIIPRKYWQALYRIVTKGVTHNEFVGYGYEGKIISSDEYDKMYKWIEPFSNVRVDEKHIPHYSGDISVAWQITEKMIHPRNPELAQRFEKLLCASHFHLLTAEKAAFEICKAALKAVMT